MRYKFYSPVQGIIDYDFNKDMEYDAYFDEYCIEDLEKKDFDYLTGEDITVYEEYINQMIEKDLKKELDEGMGLMQYFNYGSRENYKELLEKEQSYIYYKEYFLLGDKMKCGECGSEYHCYKHGDKQIWDCSKRIVKGRVHCRNQHIQEAQIKELFMQAVTKMKNHPEKIRKITIHKFKRNIRLQAVEHEIKLLKNDSSHNIDELLELIYKRASLQYEDSDDGGAEYYTNKIVDLLQQHKEQTEEKTFDKDLFESITQTITIYKDGRVMFTLKNGVNVTEMLP